MLTSLLLTIYFWSVSIVCLVFTYFICLIIYPFVDQKTFSRVYETLAGKLSLYFMTVPGFWNLTIRDRRKYKNWNYIGKCGQIKSLQYVIIANHVSFIDSMVTSMIPLKKKFMIGKVFTKYPVFGWLTEKSGFVHAEKGNTELNKLAVGKAIKAMEDKSSFILYPQGQRVKNIKEMGKFKTGAYRIAHQTGVPVLPLTIKGTEKAMPIGGWVYCADIEIIINEPFYVENNDYESYIEKSKKIILSNL